MRPFVFERVENAARASRHATGQGETRAKAAFLAGGTTLLDLMKLDVLRPERVVDISALAGRHGRIDIGPDRLTLGAFATMAAAGDEPQLRTRYPAIAQSLLLAASPQLRNMATLGGNVLQRTRCAYYRDTSWMACNKRDPGSGCAAIVGFNRNTAVLGVDEHCIAAYPGDFGVALAALDAEVEIAGDAGERRIPFRDLHHPAGQPDREHTLKPGEVIIAFHVPGGALARRSLYLKVRDRESYEFALASAAVALDLDGSVVRQARIGLGGVAYRPWRAEAAEQALIGHAVTEASARHAAELALEGAITHGANDHKPELSRRTLVRALLEAAAMEI